MGVFTITPLTKILSWLVAAVLVYLNLRMVFTEALEFLQNNHSLFLKMLVVLGLVALVALLITVILVPLLKNRRDAASTTVHRGSRTLNQFEIPVFKSIAIALDFGGQDEKLVAFALGQGNKDSRYILLHVVESASARLHGKSTADLESEKDEEQLKAYEDALKQRGYTVITRLGYRYRVPEIVRLIKEEQADLLVMGAHGHTGIQDLLYGETINQVRHGIKIPVLVVNLR